MRATTTRDLLELADWLAAQGITHIAMVGVQFPRSGNATNIENPRDAAVAFAVIVGLVLASGALRYLLGRDLSPSQINIYRSALEAGRLVPLWIALVGRRPPE
jgi:hypothetical protein